MIVHAGRLAASEDPFAKKSVETIADKTDPPEVEIFEYNQLRDQLRWLRSRYPDARAVRGLDFPIISGPEIITCDNTQFAKTRVDADRSGVLLSVPFFGPDGKLKGSVTAIILSGAIRKWLPEQDFALVNTGYHYVSHPSRTGQERASGTWVEHATPDPRLIYSERMKMNREICLGRFLRPATG